MKDFSKFLWFLKLGAILNIYFIIKTFQNYEKLGREVFIPSIILFGVSAYRCIFPNKYEYNIVFHKTIFSSIFITRLLATFSEVLYIFLFSHVIRILNSNKLLWVNLLSSIMVIQVIVSQFCVWIAIIFERLKLYFYEELGWTIIFSANTIASIYLYFDSVNLGDKIILLKLNIIFGAFYLPWQMIHLNSLLVQAANSNTNEKRFYKPLTETLIKGITKSITFMNKRTDSKSWGGFIGLTWMLGYFATLIPMWVFYIGLIVSKN